MLKLATRELARLALRPVKASPASARRRVRLVTFWEVNVVAFGGRHCHRQATGGGRKSSLARAPRVHERVAAVWMVPSAGSRPFGAACGRRDARDDGPRSSSSLEGSLASERRLVELAGSRRCDEIGTAGPRNSNHRAATTTRRPRARRPDDLRERLARSCVWPWRPRRERERASEPTWRRRAGGSRGAVATQFPIGSETGSALTLTHTQTALGSTSGA